MRNAILALLIVLVALTSIGQAQTTIPNCGAFGVDLSSISFDISKNVSTPTDPGYIYVVHPCGAVTDAGCVADSTSDGSMVCQRGLSDAYSLSKWNASTVIYSRDRFGLYQQLITGELCGANPRQSIIYYQCSQADTTPRMISVVESPQCVYNIVIYTSLTCALPVEAPCVFAGVDFNDMFAQGDLNFSTPATGFNWYVHMCASSTSNARCRNDSTSNTSMICQQRIDLSDSFGIAIYNESTIQWQIVPTGNNAGMMFTVPNGEYCAAAGRNRIATIQMICDPTLGLESSYIYGVAEVQTCVYQITIRTALSCSVLELTSSTGPGISLSSSWWPAQQTCSFNGYNLQSMSNGPDLHWGGFVNLVYYDFYFHMCGWVRNSQCASDSSTYNSMFCQASITNPEDNYGLDYFVPGQWVGWTTTQYGISYSSYLGELCGTSRRLTTVNFICDPQGTTRIDTVLIDPVSQCNVNMTIKTPLVCNPDGSNAPPVIPECIFNGWDFRYLTPNNDDLQLYVNGSTPYYITLHMCGEVEYRPCKLDSSASTSMICQTQAWSGGESYSLSTYVPASETWTEFPAQQMIQMHVATGELCGSTPRVANVNFICDLAFQNSTGLATQLISYNETSTCVYQLVVIANPIICPYFNGSGWNTTSSSTGTSQTTAGNTGVGTGCSNGANLPVGAIAVSIVLDSPFTSLVNSINYINTQLLNTLSNILSVPVTQLQCGELSGGLLPAVAAPTTAQSLFTFYILPPATSIGQSPISVSNTLMNIINTDPTVINMVLPIGVPLIVQGQYASLSCQAGQYPGADGSCHSPDSGSSGLSGGAIAGIVVGSIVGAILLIGIVIFLLSRDGRKNKGFSSAEGGGRGVEMADSSEHETEEESY